MVDRNFEIVWIEITPKQAYDMTVRSHLERQPAKWARINRLLQVNAPGVP